MKKIFLSLVILLATITLIQAQGPQGRKVREAVKREKMEFFSQFIGLNPEETKKFADIYDPFEQKRHQLNRDRKITMEYYNLHIDELTSEEAIKAITKLRKYDKLEMEINAGLYDKMQQFLTPQKMIKFLMAEEEFRRHLLKKYKCMPSPGQEKPDDE